MISRVRFSLILIGVVAVFSVSADERELFREAEFRFSAGSYELAIDRYETLIEEYPRSVHLRTARFRIAQSYFFLQDYPQARDRFASFAARFPGDRDARSVDLWLGLSLYHLGERDEADRFLSTRIETIDSTVPGQLIGRAYLYRALNALAGDDGGAGHEERIEQDLRQAIALADDAEQRYAVTMLMRLISERRDDEAVLDVWNDHASAYGESAVDQELRLRYAADAAFRLGRTEQAQEYYERLSTFSADSAQWALQRLYQLAGDDEVRRRELFRRAEMRLSAEPARLRAFWLVLGNDALREDRNELAELYLYRVWELRADGTVPSETAPALAEALRRQNRRGEAVAILEEALSGTAGPTAPQTPALLAEIFLDLNRPEEAREVILAELPDSTDARVLSILTLSEYRTGRFDDALARLQRRDLTPIVRDTPELLHLLARLRLETGEAAEAVRSFREFFAIYPWEGEVHREFLRALLEARQFDALEQEIARQRARDDGGTPEMELRYLEGLAAFHRQDFTRSVERFTGVSDLAFEPYRSYHLAWSLYRIGRSDDARRSIEPIVTSLPDALRAGGAYLYGWTLYQSGEYQSAANAFQQALAATPETDLERDIRSVLASVYLSLDLEEEALVQFEVIRSLADSDRERAAAWRAYADALASIDRIDEAVAEYDLLSARYPSEPAGVTALLSAGELLEREERYVEARDRYREFRARHPDSPDIARALYGAGLASYELGEEARALLWWEPLVERYPDSRFAPEALFSIAEIYESRGERREALEMYARFSAVYRGHRLVDEAERRRRRLRLELDGLSGEEAELWVALERGNAGEPPEEGSSEWFQLVLRLGRIAVRERFSLTMQQRGILDYLVRASEYEGRDAAEAGLLIAEYYRRQGEFRRAIDEYAAVAGMAGATAEMRAQSLYEFAVLADEIGDPTSMRRAVEELERSFPDSVWTERAGARMGDEQ